MLIPLLCTGYFAALTWGLYSVLSTPGSTPRGLVWGLVGATGSLFLLQATHGPLLGTTTGSHPMDKFFFLLEFSGAIVVLNVVNPWLRKAFTSKLERQETAMKVGEKVLVVNAFLANKAIYVMMCLYQVLAIWVPRIV